MKDISSLSYQIKFDKLKMIPKIDLQLIGQDNDLRNNVSLDLQKKLADVLKFEKENMNDKSRE